jgi:hypothetical protein
LSKKLAALALLSGLALAGCTETAPGQAVQPARTSTVSPGWNPSEPTIPARPRELQLNGLDPCKLLTKPQLDQIKVNRQRNLVQTEQVYKDAPLCAMDGGEGQVFFGYSLWLITTEGIEPWLGGKRNVDAKLITVDGFPAASYKLRGTSHFDCVTSVGVANGQQLAMNFQPLKRDAFTQEQMCQKSEQAAAFAVQTLKTLK